MSPTININRESTDYIFVTRLFNPWSFFTNSLIEDRVSRGDIVSLVSPKNPKESFVKRIVGMPGDRVK